MRIRESRSAGAGDAARSVDPVIGDHLAGRRPGLLSGLVCAGANTQTLGRADGDLTAEEFGSADLAELQLVVLSACETGLGRPQAGEGLLGVRRAFLTAGAPVLLGCPMPGSRTRPGIGDGPQALADGPSDGSGGIMA